MFWGCEVWTRTGGAQRCPGVAGRRAGASVLGAFWIKRPVAGRAGRGMASWQLGRRCQRELEPRSLRQGLRPAVLRAGVLLPHVLGDGCLDGPLGCCAPSRLLFLLSFFLILNLRNWSCGSLLPRGLNSPSLLGLVRTVPCSTWCSRLCQSCAWLGVSAGAALWWEGATGLAMPDLVLGWVPALPATVLPLRASTVASSAGGLRWTCSSCWSRNPAQA